MADGKMCCDNPYFRNLCLPFQRFYRCFLAVILFTPLFWAATAGFILSGPTVRLVQASDRPLQIPVLCYHTFHDETAGPEKPGRLSESYENLEALLRYLQRNGIQTLLPAEPLTMADPASPVDSMTFRSRIILTFDDGHPSQLRAATLLEQYGMRGVFFVIPAFIDMPGYPHFSSRDILSLLKRGHMIGVHGYRHRSMPVSGPEIVAVLDTVPGMMSRLTGYPESSFNSLAYPYGHYTPSVRNAMRLRYPLQYTVDPGYWDGQSPLVPRILITRDNDLQFYKDYTSGRYAGSHILDMIHESGSRRTTALFRAQGDVDFRDLYIHAVSPDRYDRHYTFHPIGDHVSRYENDTRADHVFKLDLDRILERFYVKENRALSFLIARGSGDTFIYVSDGFLIWVTRETGD